MAPQVLALAALAGAIQVVSPDHWLPSSVLSWQKGWSSRRGAAFAGLLLGVHVLLGLGLFLLVRPWLNPLSEWQLDQVSLELVLGFTFFRMLRFSKIRKVLLAGPHSRGGLIQAMALLGPCEFLIPLLAKTGHLGLGYLTPSLAFGIGTALVGTTLMLWGTKLWSEPLWLPWGIRMANRRILNLPVVAAAALGVSAILHLS